MWLVILKWCLQSIWTSHKSFMDFYIGQNLTKMVKSFIITFLKIIKFFCTNIITYEVLHGHVSFLFEKDEHFYKFITLQIWNYKKYIVKHILKSQKFGQKWSIVACKFPIIFDNRFNPRRNIDEQHKFINR